MGVVLPEVSMTKCNYGAIIIVVAKVQVDGSIVGYIFMEKFL